MKDLTKRQRQVLDFIVDRIEEVGYPPTIREIGVHMNISSTNGVSDHLRALVRKGYLLRDESKSRALRPVNHVVKRKRGRAANDNIIDIPVVGRIAAGEPIPAFEEADEHISIGSDLLGRTGNGEIFALRVRGESMIGDGIFDGDLIFVRRQNVATKGEIVVAMIDGEATVKRFYPYPDEIHFEPSNPEIAPIVVNRADFRDTQLLGVVIGVYRQV